MGAKNIGNLKVNIGANTKDLSKGIGRAKAMMRSLGRVAKVTAVASGAAFAAASVGMASMTKSGLSFVDAQAKMARSVDGTIDGLRALQIAGGDAGVEVGVMNGAIQMMGKRLAEAAREGTGPAADALKILGLNARELMEMDVDARFGAIADRMNEMGLSAQDAAGLMRDFGVRSNEVSLALLQGSGAIRAARAEVDKFGLSLSKEMAGGVERANDAMSRMGFVFEAMRVQIAVQLAPLLEELAVNFQNASHAGGPLQSAVSLMVSAFGNLASVLLDPAFLNAATLFGVTIANSIAGAARVMVVLADNAEIAGLAMVALGGAMLFFSGPIGLAVAAVAGGVALLSTGLATNETVADNAALAEKRLMEALDGVDRASGEAVASGKDLIEGHITQARAALAAAQAEYALEQAEQSRVVEMAKLIRENQPGNLFPNLDVDNALDDQAQLDIEYDKIIAKRAAQVEKLQKVLEGFGRSQFPTQGTRPAPVDDGGGGGSSVPAQMARDLEALFSKLDPAAAGVSRVKAAMVLLTNAKMAGLITDEEYIYRAGQIRDVLGKIPEVSGAAAAGLDALRAAQKAAAAASAEGSAEIEGALGTLINTLDSGSDAARKFLIEIVKIFAIRGISKILGGGDWMNGSLVSIPGNALGTNNWRGGASWVGENGPEIMNIPRGAQIIPNNKLGGGGGGSFTYAPVIDARGASLAAMQELKAAMQIEAAQFNGKVELALGMAKKARRI